MEMQMQFPVGDTYKFDLSVSNRLDGTGEPYVTIPVRRLVLTMVCTLLMQNGTIEINEAFPWLPLAPDNCNRPRHSPRITARKNHAAFSSVEQHIGMHVSHLVSFCLLGGTGLRV